eukprot:gene6957-8902_t
MKKKKEEEAAALVYEQFVASFDVNESGKTFVRGVAEGPAIGKAVAAKGEIYTMDSKKQSSELEKRTGVREMDRMLEEMKERDVERSQRDGSSRRSSLHGSSDNRPTDDRLRQSHHHTSSVASKTLDIRDPSSSSTSISRPSKDPGASSGSGSSGSGGNKQIDEFLNEIMSRQEGKSVKAGKSAGGTGMDMSIESTLNALTSSDPLASLFSSDSSSAAADSKGSFDTGDPQTTNLYVGNLAPTITEE